MSVTQEEINKAFAQLERLERKLDQILERLNSRKQTEPDKYPEDEAINYEY